MVKLWPLMLVFIWAMHTRGTNIMLNKPTVQSSTMDSDTPSSIANDGYKDNRLTHTRHEQGPYWQGDLLGVYIVHNISVTSTTGGLARHLRNASIGVSVHGVDCSDGEVTQCGQWPDAYLSGRTLVYNCSDVGPVRYIRIWRDVDDGLALSEVEVEGEPSRIAGAGYNRVMLETVSTPISSLTVINAGDCGRMCLRSQPCVAFSYSPSLQPNCILATNTTMTSDVQWNSYQILECFPRPTCDFQ